MEKRTLSRCCRARPDPRFRRWSCSRPDSLPPDAIRHRPTRARPIRNCRRGLIARSSRPQAAEFLARVDHLVYATPDLDVGIDTIEKLLGIRATLGGQHFGKGTRNALIALGSSTYLEIVGPDALQPKPETRRWFGIDDLPVPKLVAWAAKGNDLTRLVTEAADQGVDLGGVKSGSRRRLDGLLLTWQFTDPGSGR